MTILFGNFALKPNGELVKPDGRKARVRALSAKCLDPEDLKLIQPTFMKWLVEGVTVTPQWENERNSTAEGLHVKLSRLGDPDVVLNALDIALHIEAYGEEQARQHYLPRLGSLGSQR